MRTWLAGFGSLGSRFAKAGAAGALLTLLSAAFVSAQEKPAGEASLKLPDLSQVSFLGTDGHKLLTIGILFCIFGLIFGLAIYSHLKNLPVHRAMREVSELIYETCKTYLITQGKFLLFLWVFIAVVIVLYFGVLSPVPAGQHHAPDYSFVQPSGNGRKLRSGLVRDPRKYLCEFAYGLCRAARQAVPHLPDSAASRHEHRHDADQRGIDHDALYPAFYSWRVMRGHASSGLPSVNRWAPRRCASPAAFSPKLPTSVRT